MSSRRFYLRLMLISLIAAAVGGAICVLFLHGEATWRVIGTALITALASALMLPASTLTVLPDRKAASNLAMGIIMLEFILSLFAIWISDSDIAANLGLTILVVFVTAIPAIIFLGTFRQSAMMVAAPVGLALCAISLALFLVATWMPENSFSFDNWPVWRSGWLFYLFALLSTGAMVGFIPNQIPTFWRLLGVVAGGAAFWRSFYTNFGISRVGLGPDFIFCTNLAILIGYISLALPVPLGDRQRWVRKVSIYAVAATGFFVTLNSFAGPSYGKEFLFLDRITAAAGIIAGCGTLALLLLSQMNQTGGSDMADDTEIRQITIICPRCRSQSTLPLGRSVCPKCGLGLALAIESAG